MLYPVPREARDALRDDQPTCQGDLLLQLPPAVSATVREPVSHEWPR